MRRYWLGDARSGKLDTSPPERGFLPRRLQADADWDFAAAI